MVSKTKLEKYAFGYVEFDPETGKYVIDTSQRWFGKRMIFRVDGMQPLNDEFDTLIEHVCDSLGNHVRAYSVCAEADYEVYRAPKCEGNIVVQGYNQPVDECVFETEDLRDKIDLPDDAGEGEVFHFVFSANEDDDEDLVWGVFYPLQS